MADMDTYNDEPRGYEGNHDRAGAFTAPHKRYGYHGHSEILIVPNQNFTMTASIACHQELCNADIVT